MPDYIYLLENRLSRDQQKALRQIAQAARDAGMNVFLAGGAVRDLTSGASVRDLDVAVQGNALKLKKQLIKEGAVLWGEQEASRTLFFRFSVGVRVEISSTRREEFPKPAKPVYHWDDIHADLRRRDFTANAMSLSLNEHSYGLLMDPLNGVADIEARQLRLVSPYGFREDPARLLRATRLASRMGWTLEERTKARFDAAKEEAAIESLSSFQKGYELQEIGHEEDGLQILSAMEAEGWMTHLYPAWTRSKADVKGLEEMQRLLTQLQMQGVSPDISSVSIRLLTAKLSSKELSGLKRTFVRPGFVQEWERLDAIAKDFSKQLTSKDSTAPSATWKLFTSADPQAVLWLGLTSKSAPVQAKYKNFFTVWPEARQKVPHALMQELRITPGLPGYEEMLRQMFFASIDGKLETEAEMRAFLEPYSPPAPPPPVTIRRGRSARKAETKVKPAAKEPKQAAQADVQQSETAAPSELKQNKPSAKGKSGASAPKPRELQHGQTSAVTQPAKKLPAAPPTEASGGKDAKTPPAKSAALKATTEKAAKSHDSASAKKASHSKPTAKAGGAKKHSSAPSRKPPAKKRASAPAAKSAKKK